MKKVCIIPGQANENKYIHLMKKSIEKSGNYIVPSKGFKKIFESEVIQFNWFENIGGNNLILQSLDFIKKICFIFFVNILNKKIVWTMHNKVPHQQNVAFMSNNIMHLFSKYSDAIIVHCKESYEVLKNLNSKIDLNKVHYVPHPNYIDEYKDEIQYSGYSKKNGELIILFLGQVRKYKNVEKVIKVANELRDNPHVKFLICGKCSSKDYENELRKSILSDNVILDLRFIEDSEMPSLFRMVDILVLPYNTTSSLNSGAAILAFSYKKTIISTDIGTVNDLERTNLLYIYKYSEDEVVHIKNLYNSVSQVLNDWSNDKNVLNEKGEKLFDIMKEDYGIDTVAKKLSLIYSSL